MPVKRRLIQNIEYEFTKMKFAPPVRHQASGILRSQEAMNELLTVDLPDVSKMPRNACP